MPISALIPPLVLALGFIAYCLNDLREATVQYLPKWAWAVIIVASVPVGGIAYLVVARHHQ